MPGVRLPSVSEKAPEWLSVPTCSLLAGLFLTVPQIKPYSVMFELPLEVISPFMMAEVPVTAEASSVCATGTVLPPPPLGPPTLGLPPPGLFIV